MAWLFSHWLLLHSRCSAHLLNSCTWYNLVAVSLTTPYAVFKGHTMTESQTAINKASPKVKRIPIQERSVLMGNVICLNGYIATLSLLSVLHPPLKLTVLAYYRTTVSSISGIPRRPTSSTRVNSETF